MEKLNNNQVASLELRSGFGLGSASQPIYDRVAELLVGEAILIKEGEWPLKSLPNASNIPSRIRQKEKGFGVRFLKNGSGFIILRVR